MFHNDRQQRQDTHDAGTKHDVHNKNQYNDKYANHKETDKYDDKRVQTQNQDEEHDHRHHDTHDHHNERGVHHHHHHHHDRHEIHHDRNHHGKYNLHENHNHHSTFDRRDLDSDRQYSKSPLSSSRHQHSEFERSHVRSPLRHATSHYDAHNPRHPPGKMPKHEATLRHNEEKELVATLTDLLSMETDLEKNRIDLALKPDFNMTDLFRMFDIENKGYITFDEFKSALSMFHIFPTRDDAFLLFKRYETVAEGVLKYSDFNDIFCPKTEEYSAILTNRQAYYVNKPYYRISEYFHPETRRAIEALLADNLAVESIAETMRQHLTLIPTFNIMDAFNTCDMKNDGYLDRSQFKLLLEAHGIFNKNSDYLIDRFDKTKNGKVSYGEFADEVRPKSPIRRVGF